MISKQIIQTCIDELKELTKVDFMIIDTEGLLLATTFKNNNVDTAMLQGFFDSHADSQIISGNYLFKVLPMKVALYTVYHQGRNPTVKYHKQELLYQPEPKLWQIQNEYVPLL